MPVWSRLLVHHVRLGGGDAGPFRDLPVRPVASLVLWKPAVAKAAIDARPGTVAN